MQHKLIATCRMLNGGENIFKSEEVQRSTLPTWWWASHGNCGPDTGRIRNVSVVQDWVFGKGQGLCFSFLKKKKSSAVWHKATSYVEKSPNTEKLFIFARKQTATANDEKKKQEKSCKRNTNQTDRDGVRFNSFCDVIHRSRNKDSRAFFKRNLYHFFNYVCVCASVIGEHENRR